MAFYPYGRANNISTTATTPLMGQAITLPSENAELKDALTRALTYFNKACYFHKKLALKLQIFGLQGHKRWHKCQYMHNFKMLSCLQHYIIDRKDGLELYPTIEEEYDIAFKDTQEYLKIYKDFEDYAYKEVSEIVTALYKINEMIWDDYIKCELHNISKELEKIWRWTIDYSKSNWEWHHIRVFDQVLHDKLKIKMEDSKSDLLVHDII